jgi:hypothetical protein
MKIEGIPDGWELVRIGTPLMGEFKLNFKGEAIKSFGCEKNANIPIIRKIEKPKRYRPFANAQEFTPYKNLWAEVVNENDNYWVKGERVRCVAYCDSGATYEGHSLDWEDAFKTLCFRQGRPVGMEVTE